MKKILLFLMLSCFTLSAQEVAKGKELFNTNCAACHNMERKMTGPALQNTVAAQGREWTTNWITNSSDLIKSGDTHANEIFKEYNEMPMPSFSYLKTDELTAIVDYLENFSKEKAAAKLATVPVAAATLQTAATNQSLPVYLYVLMVAILIITILSVYIIVKVFKILVAAFDNNKIVNNFLLKKLNITKENVDNEVETLLDDMVTKRVNKKVSTIKKEINQNLKKFK